MNFGTIPTSPHYDSSYLEISPTTEGVEMKGLGEDWEKLEEKQPVTGCQ